MLAVILETKSFIMKKQITFLIFFVSLLSNAQSAKKMLAEIEGKWKIDDNGNVTFVKILEVPEISKNEIFMRAGNYFIYNYGSGNSVIETKDKDQGLIIGKGVYKNIHTGFSILQTYVSTWHVVRIDIQEGRARIIISLTSYDKLTMDGNVIFSQSSASVSENYPINEKGSQKTIMTKAFYKSYQAVQNSLISIEKAIREGNTSSNLESQKW